MKRTITYLITLLAAVTLATVFFMARGDRDARPGAVVMAESESAVLVAAPGRVEPISEEIKVGSEISGKLKSVAVEEGDSVRRGEVLAVLENDDYRAQVASAEARLSQKEAELRRVNNGARRQERLEVWEAVKEAQASMENARAEMERRKELHQKGIIALEESDRAEREYKMARARHEAALQRHSLVDDEAREEDRSKAEAEVRLARAQLDEARALLDKTFIRSPIDGVILRKHMRAGESVSDMRDAPVVTLADLSVLRVRVEVDETDVGKIRVGQKAYVTADAYEGEKFWGRVVRLGQVLGKKNVRTDEPSERVDTKILETLVELDGASKLTPGLRVDAFVVVSGGL
jgi:HlyD family secretion protein